MLRLEPDRIWDIRTRDVPPPLSEPAGFGELMGVHVRRLDERSMLVFTCRPEHSPDQVPGWAA